MLMNGGGDFLFALWLAFVVRRFIRQILLVLIRETFLAPADFLHRFAMWSMYRDLDYQKYC